MANYQWLVAFGGLFGFLSAFAIGANLVATVWGPAIGAKAVSYRTALLLGLVCQLVGLLVFGPRTVTIYWGILTDYTTLQPHPELTLYSLMWTAICVAIWQLLAIWKQVLVPAYLGNAASTVGVALVWPGVKFISFGGGDLLSDPPFLPGLGPVFLTWCVAPLLSLILVTGTFLVLRTFLMRGEDPFHKVIWALPSIACFAAIVCGLDLIYAIGSPQGSTILNMLPQTAVVVLAAVGCFFCVCTCLLVPRFTRQLRTRGPAIMQLKRMNLLGLDEETVHDLALSEKAEKMTSWPQRVHGWLFDQDIFATVISNDALMRIHGTAEEFEPAAEECFIPLQVVICMLVSMAYGANNARTSVGVYALMYSIYSTGTVEQYASISITLRCMGAVGMGLGTLFCGFRLAPVTGVQLAKLSPFRSFVVISSSALVLTIMAILQFRGGTATYVITSAVMAVGLAEGSSHVHWQKVRQILAWWFFGFFLVLCFSAALVAQGEYAPCVTSPTLGNGVVETLTASLGSNGPPPPPVGTTGIGAP